MELHQQALNKAKIALMSREDSAFFTTICFSLKHLWDTEIQTAATDGKAIMFNPVFFMSLTPEERIFLVLHETLHVAFIHMLRLSGRVHAKWNVACDHVINLMLIERGFKMPKMGLADRKYLNMSAEDVYKILPDQEPSNVDMDLQEGDEDPKELQKDIEDILIRASIQSKLNSDKPGTIPGEIEIFLNGLLKPKLPWNRILQKYLQALVKEDYSFRKPNRRFFPEHYLPSLYSEKLIDIAIAVDSSGSVTDEQFKVFISETHSILRMCKPNKISLVQFDSYIRSVDEIKSIRELSQVKFKGRGDTEITPVLAWANEHKPQLLLVFSDGEFHFRNADTKVNTVWLIHENKGFKAPFGKTIHYDI